jgi:fructokinase
MKVLGFGAILWDDVGGETAAGGSVAGERNIGGAVFNVIVHLQKLGYEAYMLSAIGGDRLGEKTFQEVDRLKIHRDFIGAVSAPTCLIKVSFDRQGFPHYSSPSFVSWDQIELDERRLERIANLRFDCLVFGTLEQRSAVSRDTLHRLLEREAIGTVYIDLTLRGDFYSRELLDYCLRRANIAKMNDEEALAVSRLFGLGQEDPGKLLPLICREFDNDIVCITLGDRGALIGDRSTTVHRPAYKVRVQDTVGSGDAFSAGLLYKLGQGAPLEEACDFANKMGALISSKKSSIPDYGLAELDALVDTH